MKTFRLVKKKIAKDHKIKLKKKKKTKQKTQLTEDIKIKKLVFES